MDLGISGLASGFDWRSLVDQLTDVERAPQRRLLAEQKAIRERHVAFGSIKTQLGVLQNRLTALQKASLFESRLATSSDAGFATATAQEGTPLGTYRFNVSQLATAAVRQGTNDIGAALSATDDVSSLVLSSAGFSTAITAGVFSVDGHQVTIETSDTLAAVFTKISTATEGAVTATYNSRTDTISLNSSTEIVLGTSTDTSNFLQVTKLSNNGSNRVTSTSSLGGIRRTALLNAANFQTAISDGGSGTGEFKINGVSISFNASSESLNNVLTRINESTAGVIATYDPLNDRVTLTNKDTGDVGIGLEDVTGNFLSATGLLNGTLTRGNNLLYTINDGGSLSSRSNIITEESSGIAGLSVTALTEESFSITVSSDVAKIKTAITDFVTEYNKTQALLATQTASSTDAKGKVTAGVLASDRDAIELVSHLRALATSDVDGLDGSLARLNELGFTSNGNDDTLATSDLTALDEALSSQLAALKDLFTSPTNGIALRLDAYLERTIGEDGTLLARQSNLDHQATDIDTQISTMERLVLTRRQAMIDSFVAMEKAQAQINQQLQFLQQRFPAAS